MPTLAIDCSFSGLTLVLQKPSANHADSQWFAYSSPTPRSSDVLAVELQKLLEESNIKPQDITRTVVTVGPGSFTGCRLGLAAAEALKIVNSSMEINGISTLQALATQVSGMSDISGPFTLLLDAAGGQVYIQTFDEQARSRTIAQCLPLAEALAAIPPGQPVAAQSGLFLPFPSIPLEAVSPQALLETAQNPANHLPPQPVYVKNLTYKTNA